MDKWIFETPPSDTFEVLAENIWTKFSFYELCEVIRQKEDFEFSTILNRLREDNPLSSDIQFLCNKAVSNDQLEISSETTHLFYYNKDVD